MEWDGGMASRDLQKVPNNHGCYNMRIEEILKNIINK